MVPKKVHPPPKHFQKRAEKKGKKRSERGPKKVHKMVLQLFKVLKMVPMKVHSHKVNRCLARYSPRATTTNRPTNRALNKPAWPGPN